MTVVKKSASAIGLMVDLLLGENFVTPAAQVIKQYPYVQFSAYSQI